MLRIIMVLYFIEVTILTKYFFIEIQGLQLSLVYFLVSHPFNIFITLKMTTQRIHTRING